jgi:lantibiotic leader peptide-processing serine protease
MRFRYAVAVGLSAALAASTGVLAPTSSAQPGTRTDYLVLFKSTKADDAARSAIARSGGRITEVNAKIGYAYVSSDRSDFAASMTRTGTVAGVAAERTIGSARDPRPKARDVERVERERASASGHGRADAKPGRRGSQAVTPEPLAGLQWDMRQIDATATGSYAKDTGTKKVKVGIIDTGVDGSHPDIAANFDKAGSRNFVTDMTDIDGPCEHPSCVDPVDEDDDGHGTHVASTIGSPINGLGVAGVAPNVSLLNIRAGQDSGYFFLQPTLKALTYAGDSGVDVVNMSFYIDPWLYNCVDNPADSPAEQAEQRTVRAATQRAVNYATHRGVLPVSAMGNEATDLNSPTFDPTSPDYPVGAAKDRTVDNSCITVPTETEGVVAVSSTGPSKRLAYYSNYGTEQTDVAAPGGDFYDSPDNHGNPQNIVLAAYPESLARANGDLNDDGTPNNAFVVRDCKGTVCGYYQYLQGTSMASPHAAGVAALVVGRYGHADRRHGGLTMSTAAAERQLYRTAVPTPCPTPRTYHYTRITGTGAVIESDATCEGTTRKNGFYGRGIVNAERAVSRGHH